MDQDRRVVRPRRRRPEGVSRRQAARHHAPPGEVKVPCPVCDKRVGKLKPHVKQSHLPFFYYPNTCCWPCGNQLAKESALRRHVVKEHGGTAPARQTAEAMERWAPLMFSFFFSLAASLGLVSLEALVAFAQAKALFDLPPERQSNPPDERSAELLRCVVAAASPRHLRPDLVVKLLDCRVVTELLRLSGPLQNNFFPRMDLLGVPPELAQEAVVVDAHAHLDKLLEPRMRTLQAAVRRARAPGRVCAVVNSYCFPEHWPVQGAIAGPVGFSFHCYGIHPRRIEAQWGSDIVIPFLTAVMDDPRVVALGEIGLDYYDEITPATVSEQCRVLADLLELATRKKKPVVIHCRGYGRSEAPDDCFRILSEVLNPYHPVYFHCFSDSVQIFQRLHQAFPNAVFGFAPCFSATIAAVGPVCPLTHAVLETDAPYLTKDPGDVRTAATALARIHNVSPEQVCTVTALNAARFFGLPPSIFTV